MVVSAGLCSEFMLAAPVLLTYIWFLKTKWGQIKVFKSELCPISACYSYEGSLRKILYFTSGKGNCY